MNISFNWSKCLLVASRIIGFLVFWIAIVALERIEGPGFLEDNVALRRMWWEIVPLISVLLATLIFTVYIDKFKFEKSTSTDIFSSITLGVVFGICWIGTPIALLYCTGYLSFGEIISVKHLHVWIIACIFNVIMQNYLVKGYIFHLLKHKYNVLTAIVVTSLIFTLMHRGAFEAGALAVSNVLTMSVFTTMLLIYTKGLLAPIIAHSIWNTTGFLLGLISMADFPAVSSCTINGSKLISGGVYKLEGSLIVFFVNIVCILLLYKLIIKKTQKPPLFIEEMPLTTLSKGGL